MVMLKLKLNGFHYEYEKQYCQIICHTKMLNKLLNCAFTQLTHEGMK